MQTHQNQLVVIILYVQIMQFCLSHLKHVNPFYLHLYNLWLKNLTEGQTRL